MLLDPKWAETKPNPFSVAAFIGWLETKDPSEEYDYMNTEGECAVGQYMKFVGIDWWGGSCWTDPAFVEAEPYLQEVASKKPHTFGAALDRARALERAS